jgi:hypothetical protein
VKNVYVYVAGPLNGSGTQDRNIRRACLVAEEIRRAGLVPFVPHLNVLWALVCPTEGEEEWMRWDLAWLEKCDALYRLSGVSPGADREVARAKQLGISVFLEEEDGMARQGVQ